jgi:hypothetical protein
MRIGPARFGHAARRATWNQRDTSTLPLTRRAGLGVPCPLGSAHVRWIEPMRSEAVECTVASSFGGVARWPAGPLVRSALHGSVFSPFALVTFIWGRK